MIFFFFTSFLTASAGYLLLKLFRQYVFAALFRMFYYHEQHPFQYIFLVCMVYTIFIVCLFSWINSKKDVVKVLLIIWMMIATIIISSPLGGVLWHTHDMQAGFFVYGTQLRDKLWLGVTWGLQLGWLIILYSFPYNILGLISGYFITSFGLKKFK